MRIIPDGVQEHIYESSTAGDFEYFDVADTIEITDAEWEAIYNGYQLWLVKKTYLVSGKKLFAQYLRDLISLAGEGK